MTVRPRLRNFDLGMSWNIQATGLGLNPHLPGLIVHSSQWRTDGYETYKVDRALLQHLPVVAYYLLTPGATLTTTLTKLTSSLTAWASHLAFLAPVPSEGSFLLYYVCKFGFCYPGSQTSECKGLACSSKALTDNASLIQETPSLCLAYAGC